jgi:lipopolysaccharide exporter
MIKHWVSNLRGNRFWGSVATLLSGSVLAQVIGVALLPVLTQLYDAEAFGVQAVFMAVVQTLVIAANGGYDQAIMLPEKMHGARSLLRLSQGVNLVMMTLLGLLLWGMGDWLWAQMSITALVEWQWLLVLSLGLEGSMQPLRMMLNRLETYRALAVSKLVQALISGGVMIGLGWEQGDASGLLMGWASGLLGAWVILGLAYIRVSKSVHVPWTSLWQVAREYRDFPLKSVGAGWLNTLTRQLPFYLLPVFFGQAVNGYYFMAYRALMMPLALVSRAIGEVYYRQVALAKHESQAQVTLVTRRTARQLLALGALPTVIVMLLGPWLAGLVLGAEWEAAGVYARWLMPWGFITFVTAPLTCLIDLYRRLDIQLLYNVALMIGRGGILLFGGYYLGASETILCYALSGAGMVMGYLIYLLRLADLTMGRLMGWQPYRRG